jgi:hypothetical protein
MLNKIVVLRLAAIGMLARSIAGHLVHVRLCPEVITQQPPFKVRSVNKEQQQWNDDSALPLDNYPDGHLPARFRWPGW